MGNYLLGDSSIFHTSPFSIVHLVIIYSRLLSWRDILSRGLKNIDHKIYISKQIVTECLFRGLPLCREPCNYLLSFHLDILDLWKWEVRGQIVYYCSPSILLAMGAFHPFWSRAVWPNFTPIFWKKLLSLRWNVCLANWISVNPAINFLGFHTFVSFVQLISIYWNANTAVKPRPILPPKNAINHKKQPRVKKGEIPWGDILRGR